MNFFGHAAMAGHFSREPSFVLGAMLPDFCGMLGLRVPDPSRSALGDGVRFHHLTDHAFHELASFRALTGEATRLLDERGVRRGTARAVAHVGIELFIDAKLAENEPARALYLAALATGRTPDPWRELAFSQDERERLGGLAGSLHERGVAPRPATEAVVARLERALAARPRLAIRSADRTLVTEWV